SSRMRLIDMSSASLPVLGQAAIGPVPEEICEELRMTSLGVGGRHAHADADQDVLRLVERDLHLRHDVDSVLSAVDFFGPENRRHRRPRAAEAMILREAPAPRLAEVHRVLDVRAVARRHVAAMELDEARGTDGLVEHRERLPDGCALAEAGLLLAG